MISRTGDQHCRRPKGENARPVKRQRIVAGLQQSHEAELERRQSTTEAFERYAQTQQISSTINRPVNCITMDILRGFSCQ